VSKSFLDAALAKTLPILVLKVLFLGKLLPKPKLCTKFKIARIGEISMGPKFFGCSPSRDLRKFWPKLLFKAKLC